MSSGNLLPVLIVPRHDSCMANYDIFAKFYDLVMGDRTSGIELVRRYIERYRPSASSLLELGCGTGAVVAGLAERHEDYWHRPFCGNAEGRHP
jgi:ubiquinone/menaquinone biosynthesis C-methylase UbiE